VSTANDVEAIVVAPATAHWLGAMAHGLAGDSITAACLATSVPVVVAPAMDGGMYAHPATQANVAQLREFGYSIVEPESGPLASGLVGQGRLATLSKIVDATVEAVHGGLRRARTVEPASADERPRHATRSDLAGMHIVVTAGGTAEPIDPVRFVGNRSSGKMGIAVAEEALDRGAAVTLILGNVSVEPPAGARIVRAQTAAEMQSALLDLTPSEGPVFDVLVMAAAVADFRPRKPSDRKVSRADGLSLDLESTPDLLAEAAARVRAAAVPGMLRPVLVGFAAETGSFDRAAAKLEAKGVDLLVANDVAEQGSGFGTDTNRVTVYAVDGPPEALPLLPKRRVAELLLDRVVGRLAARIPASVSVAATSPEERR
jgi:phosphopantothenoylcysteine decarboxylase/phosphopantothenate--cysteine ligase